MTYVVECHNISKNFNKTKALVDINTRFKKDKIYGLLGRNGAGKSTLLNIFHAQIFPTQGEVKVFGATPYENNRALERTCLVKESGMFLKDLKVGEALHLTSLFYPDWDKDFAERLLDEFELDTSKTYKNLSLGMKSQLGIIVGLASRAPLTIFDEPYIGLDAPGRQFFYDILMDDYMKNPRTIIISTHLIDEVSNLLEEIIILHKGSIKMEGNIDDIRNKAYYISGNKEVLEKHVGNRKVLYKNEIEENTTVSVFDEISETDRKAMEYDDLIIKSMSLQQLFINLTRGKMARRGEISE